MNFTEELQLSGVVQTLVNSVFVFKKLLYSELLHGVTCGRSDLSSRVVGHCPDGGMWQESPSLQGIVSWIRRDSPNCIYFEVLHRAGLWSYMTTLAPVICCCSLP